MIDSYSFGRIIVDGKHYRRDIIIFPDRIKDNWWRKEGHHIEIEDLKEIVQEKPEILIIGTGYFGHVKVPTETKEYLKSNGIELMVQSTIEASNTFNSILKSKKRVVAALHLAC